jgi:hypothetical protein
MIELKLKMTTRARADLQKAFKINPYFSLLHQKAAREALASLGSRS